MEICQIPFRPRPLLALRLISCADKSFNKSHRLTYSVMLKQFGNVHSSLHKSFAVQFALANSSSIYTTKDTVKLNYRKIKKQNKRADRGRDASLTHLLRDGKR